MRKLYTDDKGHTRSYEPWERLPNWVEPLITFGVVAFVIAAFVYGLVLFGLVDFS